MNLSGASALVAALVVAGALVFDMPEGRAWRLEPVPLDARLTAIETFKDDVRVAADRRWYRVVAGEGAIKLALSAMPNRPSFDRRALRLLAFSPSARELARIDLPARVVMEVATLRDGAGVPLIVLGLDDDKLYAIRR